MEEDKAGLCTIRDLVVYMIENKERTTGTDIEYLYKDLECELSFRSPVWGRVNVEVKVTGYNQGD